MRRRTIVGSMLGAAALLLSPGTSLSAAAPPNGGTIFVVSPGADDDDPASQASQVAASKALGAKGFTLLNDPGHAAYVAEVTTTRKDVGMGQEKVSAGRASMMGAGVSVPFSTGQSRLVLLQRTELRIIIRKRGEQQVLWQGAAVTVRPVSGARTSDTVASILSEAALRLYPQESAEIAGVP